MGTGTEIGRVRGLGSAKSGAHRWWLERLTSGGSLLISLWFLFSLLRLPAYDFATVAAWLASPVAAVGMILFVFVNFWHARLGLQVVIEDYQHDESRLVGIVLLNFFAIGLGALAIFSILKVAFGAGAA